MLDTETEALHRISLYKLAATENIHNYMLYVYICRREYLQTTAVTSHIDIQQYLHNYMLYVYICRREYLQTTAVTSHIDIQQYLQQQQTYIYFVAITTTRTACSHTIRQKSP